MSASKQTGAGPSKRTQEQRDVARCAAYLRPLTLPEQLALRYASRGRLSRTRGSWSEQGGCFFKTATVAALAKRGFLRVHARRFAIITRAGRREAARHP